MVEITLEAARFAASATDNLNLFERRHLKWNHLHQQDKKQTHRFPKLRELLLACGASKSAHVAGKCTCQQHRPFPSRLRVFIPEHDVRFRPRGFKSADSVFKNGKNPHLPPKTKQKRRKSHSKENRIKYWTKDIDVGEFEISSVSIKKCGSAVYVTAQKSVNRDGLTYHEHLHRKVYPPSKVDVNSMKVRVASDGCIRLKAPIFSPSEELRAVEKLNKLSLENNPMFEDIGAPVSPLPGSPVKQDVDYFTPSNKTPDDFLSASTKTPSYVLESSL